MTSPQVHWTQPNLEAMPETDGHGDTCGPIVMADYLHITQGLNLSIAEIDTLRQNLINWNLFQAGMTLTDIATAFEQHFNTTPLKVVEWNPSLNFSAFRQDLIMAMENHQAVIMETHNAQALPDNQQGIQNHFILAWGLDSNLGYWCCNGDTYTELNTTVPGSPVWIGVGSLQAALISAYMILPAEVIKAMSIVLEETNGVITGAHDSENTTLHVGAGMAQEIETKGWLALKISVGETYTTPNQNSSPTFITNDNPEVSLCVLSTDTNPDFVFTYSQRVGVQTIQSADLAQAIINLTNEIARDKTLQATDSDTAVNAALATLKTDMEAHTTLMNKIEADLTAVETAQAAD